VRGKRGQREAEDLPQQSGFGPAQAAAPARMLTALDIQQKEFRVSRFGGYRMRDVDEFLDALTDAMAALTSENERLRRGSAPPIVGSPDLDEVSRQADEIITRAREEAARITDEARERAASLGSTSAAGPEGRAAIDAFLAQERAFLQGMAALVQDHAETVKAMARRSRQDAQPGSESGSDPGERPAPETGSEVIRDPAPDRAAETTQAMDEPIVVEEPQPTAARREEVEGDPSLRELFWGDEGTQD
jgi:DivIVA domain-containing protein